MSAMVQEFLQTWESELLQLRPNDPLIDLTGSLFIYAENELWNGEIKGKQLLKECKRIERDRGILALVQFEGVMTWVKGEVSIKTPVFLKTCTNLNAQQQHVEFDDAVVVNPFLIQLLKRAQNIELATDNQEELLAQLADFSFFIQFEPITGLANLHPQRYELRREWESLRLQLSYSTALHQILGDLEISVDSDLNAPLLHQISPLDPDQRSAVAHASCASTVIYGPPGTGKSIVLSNIISQALGGSQSVLVVADKPVALEVLIGKLSVQQLNQFCVLLPDSASLAPFYKKLQQQFEHLLQPTKEQKKTLKNEFLAAQYWTERKKIEFEAGLSFQELLEQFGPVTSTTALPTNRWKAWANHKIYLQQLEKGNRNYLPSLQKYWQDTPPIELKQDWELWKKLQAQLAKHGVSNIQELDLFVDQSLRCLQFEAKIYHQYAAILDGDLQAYLKRLQKFQQLSREQAVLLQHLQVWKQIPTIAEWTILEKAATTAGWLSKLKWRKLEKNWLRLAGMELKVLENDLKKYWRSQEQHAQIIEKFASLGVPDLAGSIGLIIPLLKQHKADNWNWYRALEQNEIEKYCQLHQVAHQFQQLHRRLFIKQITNFDDFIGLFDNNFIQLIDQHDLLKKIPFNLWEGSLDLIALQQALRKEFWATLRYHYPALYANDTRQIKSLIEEDLSREEAEWTNNAKQLVVKQQQHFKALQQLLVAPLHQLSAEQKTRRQTLRKGKAILIKEMAKTRQHLSIMELFESEAAPWLRAIFPIWLATPTALAKRLPMRLGLFDIGIFDEASQLPLSHAVGALQRISKLIVAGDPQQMRPQSYFGQSAEGVVDLLHQAAFHLPSKYLHYHYRSEDPSLIAFSNQHFYDEKLVVWPSKDSAETGLFDHFITDGCYEQQQNIPEAQAIAKHLKSVLSATSKIGVVAFSETQLQCIYQQLSPSEQALLERRIEERSAFFLALEQVQGEECEILLISFGYAKNEAQQFSLKLGPMTQAQSGRRLNVLLTRAQKSLHFYSSIRAADFPIKRSAATNKLWEWFVFLENNQFQQAAYSAEQQISSAEDYTTFLNCYRVLKQRRALPNQV